MCSFSLDIFVTFGQKHEKTFFRGFPRASVTPLIPYKCCRTDSVIAVDTDAMCILKKQKSLKLPPHSRTTSPCEADSDKILVVINNKTK